MKHLALILPLLALAACSSEPAAEPTAAATTVAPAAVSSLPAPDEALFTRLHTEACPEAEPVGTALCKRAGFGSEEVTCQYGLGDDEYRRHEATLVPAEDEWALKDAAAVCKQTEKTAG